ncbi:MAG: hypothetical protein NVS3B10_12590 [Polyangiales bacterium]
MPPRIHLATCRPLPEPDVDEPSLVEALRARGAEVSVVAWNDPDVDAADADACVIRSTWDYFHDHDRFLAWVERTARVTRLLNPARVIGWNSDKAYLRAMHDAGVPIAPTAWLEAGAPPPRLDALLDERGWDDVVLKPTVSGGSFATLRARRDDLAAADRHLAEHLPRRGMMVQRYVPSVDGHGERSLVWIDGELTHSIRKSPRFLGQAESVSSALPIDDAERATAERVLRATGTDDLLYARIDLARDEAGTPMLMELELLEPSLLLRESPAALARLADAIVRRAVAPP